MQNFSQQAKRGIAMTARNVPKVMDGSKTQTRRIESPFRFLPTVEAVVKSCGAGYSFGYRNGRWQMFGAIESVRRLMPKDDEGNIRRVKIDFDSIHQVGDILYVKEALQNFGAYAIYKCNSDNLVRRADGKGPRLWESDGGKPWKANTLPARYMPRSAARTFVEITDVRCERVQDISVEDCWAEGCVLTKPEVNAGCTVKAKFQSLWNDTNGQGAWERNDWVFAYTFELTADCAAGNITNNQLAKSHRTNQQAYRPGQKPRKRSNRNRLPGIAAGDDH